MKKVITNLQHINLVWWYILIGVGTIASYWYITPIVTAQDELKYGISSNITLNIALLYFLVGLLSDKISKRRKRLGYAILVIGILGLSLMLIMTK